jgi:Uma2 family endonuclease
MNVLAPPMAGVLDGPVLADRGRHWGVDSPADGWTAADLDLLPDDGRRYEIIDGSLVMSPSPDVDHQYMVWWLTSLLAACAPAGCAALPGANVSLSASSDRLLVPDVVAARRVDRTVLAFRPEDVLLVVEIVSRSSGSIDRVLKPKLYAQAGIPSFWRVERGAGGVAVHVFGLGGRDSGEYEELRVVRSGETAVLDTLWPVTLTPPANTPVDLSA